MGKFIDWIINMVKYKLAKTAEAKEDSLGDVKTLLALLLENYDDPKFAAAVNMSLKGEMPDFAEKVEEEEEEPELIVDHRYRLVSPPQIDWAHVREVTDKRIHWKWGITAGMAVAAVACEAASLGQIEMVLPALNLIIGNTGLVALGNDLQTIQDTEVHKKRWEQYWKSYARATLPDQRDLLTMYHKGLIGFGQLMENMALHGFHGEWTKVMINNTLKFPSTGVLENMVRRKVITLDEYKHKVEDLGYNPDSIEDMSKIIEPMHSTSSLIDFVVKEVITPESFYEYMSKQGWSIEEAKKYWEAHWRLVSLDDLREMRNRAYITDESYKNELIKHDYRPEWADQLIKLSYRRPTLAQLRQIVEYTEFTDEEIEKVISDLGFEESWIPLMRKYLVSRRISLERTRLLTELENQYTEGFTTVEEFKTELVTLGFSPDVIDMRLKKATLRNERETAGDVKSLKERRLMTELNRYVTELENQYIRGWMTVDEFKDELVALGFSLDVIDMRLKKATLRNDRERKDDLKDVYIKSYRNDYITIDELTASLTALGLREDVVGAIIALETVRKKPKELLEGEI